MLDGIEHIEMLYKPHPHIKDGGNKQNEMEGILINRRIRTPGGFFMVFLGFSLLLGIALSLIVEVLDLHTIAWDIIPSANYYFFFTINGLLTIVLTIGFLWLSTYITLKFNALSVVDVNQVVKYFTIAGVFLIIISLLIMFSPLGNLRYVFLAVIYEILPSELIAMDTIGNIVNLLISIFCFRRFLLNGAEKGNYIVDD